MRYRIISLAFDGNQTSEEWTNQTVAGFYRAADAMAVCRGLPIRAYVVDTFLAITLYQNCGR